MTPAALLWIALGGALGSVLRALAGHAFAGTRFPWGTLLINAAGSLLIGWLMARLGALEPAPAARMQSLLVVGFCGGFTTFSTFSWQTLDQLLRGQWLAAALNVLLSVALCLLTVWLGYRLGRA
ncbi:fluoride efflux transporter CrcB [Oleiharenicola sp. Vm1]|uniref:fluoride efflux transporter CrcB n=1 Tax=Oleiharenicola sp. Vm1 TaxID=3398393 RepID=UPI0039F50DD2